MCTSLCRCVGGQVEVFMRLGVCVCMRLWARARGLVFARAQNNVRSNGVQCRRGTRRYRHIDVRYRRMYTVHCPLYTVHCLHCTLYSVGVNSVRDN